MRSDDEVRADADFCDDGTDDAASRLAADVPELLADRERYRGMLAHIEAENARLLAMHRVETFIAMQVDRDNERVKRERAEDLVAEFRKRDEAASKTIARLHDLQERLVTRELLAAVVAERDEARAALAAVMAIADEHWDWKAGRLLADRLRAALRPVRCPTCSPPIRETVGMVCQTCGTDYGVAAAGVPEPPQEPSQRRSTQR